MVCSLGVFFLLDPIFNYIRDQVAKNALEYGIEAYLGLPAHIQSLRIDMDRSSAVVKNLRIMNPAEYKGQPLLEISNIFARFDPASIE